MRVLVGTGLFVAFAVLLMRGIGIPETWQDVLIWSTASGIVGIVIFFLAARSTVSDHDEYAFLEAVIGITSIVGFILSIPTAAIITSLGGDTVSTYLATVGAQAGFLAILLILDTISRSRDPVH